MFNSADNKSETLQICFFSLRNEAAKKKLQNPNGLNFRTIFLENKFYFIFHFDCFSKKEIFHLRFGYFGLTKTLFSFA